MCTFYVGQTFPSLEKLNEFIVEYERVRSVRLSKGRTKSITKSRVKDLEEYLHSYEIEMQCYRSGKYVSKARTNPPVRPGSCFTKKTNCPFKIVLRALGKKSLQVRKVVLDHNHNSPINSNDSSYDDTGGFNAEDVDDVAIEESSDMAGYDINKNTNQRRDGDYELAHSDNILRK
ncbi:uncharacterized protein LOC118745868, partial [Rhagoletis pomonella]|uniref:uncharacterized protein LOC118745868 n=1 Tax=Rhagoletis pomonella TaxID=28610 RepID=UPI0017828291